MVTSPLETVPVASVSYLLPAMIAFMAHLTLLPGVTGRLRQGRRRRRLTPE